MSKIVTLEEFAPIREKYRTEGKTLVWTNGCFDLLHAGHLQSLRLSRAKGDALIVGVNADKSVNSLKTPDRPFVNEDDRATMLAALEFVDHVIIFSDRRCDKILAAVKPDIAVKGEDYNLQTVDQDERAAVENNGGRIEFIPLVKGLSTSNLVKKIRRSDPEKIISGAFAFIRDGQNRLLMVANNYSEGIKWGLPGGGHIREETLESTVIREVEEETGLKVRIRRYLGLIERIDMNINLHLLCNQFEAEVTGGELYVRPNEEHVIEAKFLTAEEIAGFEGTILGREYVLKYLADPENYPNYIKMFAGEE